MTRALFWAGVALTIALVAFGIWYYVHDDYPFQLTSDQIAGLAYHSLPTGSPAQGVADEGAPVQPAPPLLKTMPLL